MGFLRRFRSIARITFAAALFFAWQSAPADTITLKNGGAVRGHLVNSGGASKSIAVATTSGGLIVFDRTAVENIHRGSAPKQKVPSARPKLTPAQEAWLPRVRLLAARLDGDPEKARSALDQLLEIQSPDALPALARDLADSRDSGRRRLFAAILKTMPGTRPIPFLVSQSLFDPLSQARDEARRAIGEARRDWARPLFIHSLTFGDPNLAARSALAIAAIGDPLGESVPALIDALTYDSKSVVMVQASQWGQRFQLDFYATGGAQPPSLTGLLYAGQTVGSMTTPVFLGSNSAPGTSPQVANAMRNMHQAPAAYIATPSQFGGSSGPTTMFSNPRQPTIQTQAGGPGRYVTTTVVADHYVLPVFGETQPALYAKIPTTHDNTPVLEVLAKVADKSFPAYGYNRDAWRRWWALEQQNRQARKLAAPGQAGPKSPAQR